MRKLRAALIALLIQFAFFLTHEGIFGSPLVALQDGISESKFDHSEPSRTDKMQQPPTLSLLLSLNKGTYVRQETAVATAQLLHAQTPLSDVLVTWEADLPDGTLWFTWTDNTDENGFATHEFLLTLSIPSGEYTVHSTAFKEGFEAASASTNFTILNVAPEIYSAEVTPQVVETPTHVNIKANATDFEDGTNIHVTCTISAPNSTPDCYNMTLDGALFSLSYEIGQGDPTGTYEIAVQASDSEGASTPPYQLSFENAIRPTQLGILEGIITDTTGSPISKASLTLRGTESYLTYESDTDENGRYVFNKVVHGIYVLEASADQFVTANTTIVVNDKTRLNLTLLHLPVVWGYVKKTDETPIPAALVTVSNPQGILSSSYSNESGVYRVVTSKEGSFDIKASALGFASDSLTVTLHLESATQLNFTLEKGGGVEGQVKDGATDSPVPNVVVYLGNQTHWGINTTADESGSFSFLEVSPGEYTVRATAVNYIDTSSAIQVFLGETTFIELRLLKNPAERELEWVALIVAIIALSSVSLALFLRRKVKRAA